MRVLAIPGKHVQAHDPAQHHHPNQCLKCLHHDQHWMLLAVHHLMPIHAHMHSWHGVIN